MNALELCKPPLQNNRVSKHSVQGNCVDPPDSSMIDALDGVPLLPLRQHQCLLVTETDLEHGVGSRLWLDGLYIRFQRPPARPHFGEPIRVFRSEKLWMTNLTLQACSFHLDLHQNPHPVDSPACTALLTPFIFHIPIPSMPQARLTWCS
jgi:hypothetical protein